MYDDAIPFFQKVVQLDPKNRWAFRNMGNSFLKKKMYDDAITFFSNTVQLDRTTRHLNSWDYLF
ncbi:tetratricopeptide repeat protein (macronuclear) [Tetrahymena thermophila SB210]|uniref:Tetratricopeptide repeat protein n=1 Tax=Tetrahymena thermophila (strain SB210) TaxID=312017 RepID=W7XCF1_TETTS|nr:tetratricopeptide repeat protein [Tetrahymena thermophila SB210]EWS74233.1 tetratricopeptide repeat protein [Tetrahymena thermophila SB210]|eukprot:XP_012653206.1 tetratricopeptide repeat protein [Tetrahymena thermophila SB210]